MAELDVKITINFSLTLLTDKSEVYATEKFLKETRKLKDVEAFTLKISEGLTREKRRTDVCKIKLGTSTFVFAYGSALDREDIAPDDIIFLEYRNSGPEILRNDTRLSYFMQTHDVYETAVRADGYRIQDSDSKKLYRLLGTNASFPLLTKEQLELVKTENKNVLVRGVAGSGKTNVCIDKIIYCASREYAGKSLYSTYSRGLLNDTAKRVNGFASAVKTLSDELESGKAVFDAKDKIKAVELKLGLTLDVEDEKGIISKLKRIYAYLTQKVDYLLIEDIYRANADRRAEPVDSNTFPKGFYAESNRRNGNIQVLRNISEEIVYKEVYGMIYGSYSDGADMLSEAEYVTKRAGSFTKKECEAIYRLAKDYSTYLMKNNLTDNNFMSRELLSKTDKLPKYSLAVLDEVQDMTEVNLELIKRISLKLFCVGDALQMINPSYFSFARLKNLLYGAAATDVKELTANFRNSDKIADLVNSLGALNKSKFGVHNFVLDGKSVDSSIKANTVYVRDSSFIKTFASAKYDNYTIIVATAKRKAELRALLGNREILTVSEIKGLERDTVIAYNLISDNIDKWNEFTRSSLNRKTADENSVYRYYFNLFYVGVSRARLNLCVAESAEVQFFREFFHKNFDVLGVSETMRRLADILSSVVIEQDEVIDRIEKFISLGQYENARVTLTRLDDETVKTAYANRIDVNEKYIRHGNNRGAGVAYWSLGMYDDARASFELNGDKKLLAFFDACVSRDNRALDYDIVRFYPEMSGDKTATELILSTLATDLEEIKAHSRAQSEALGKKEKKHG